jgi:DNA repair exonuclease SbcCD ATPase subunit
VSMARHLKAGFTNRWNLLIFIGACAFALVSGRADVVLPLVLAGEVVYLGLVAHRELGRDSPRSSLRDLTQDELVESIKAAIPASDFQRYEKLQRQCEDLRDISTTLDATDASEKRRPSSDPLSKLNRLLVSFLRLLYTRHLLSSFLKKTDAKSIKRDIERFESKLATLDEIGRPPRQNRLRRSVEENLKTSSQRLDNYNKIESNVELITSEIDGLETKIQSLAEAGIADREPETIAKQFEQVTASVKETEQTLQALDFGAPLDPKARDLLGPISFEDDDASADDEDFVFFEDK